MLEIPHPTISYPTGKLSCKFNTPQCQLCQVRFPTFRCNSVGGSNVAGCGMAGFRRGLSETALGSSRRFLAAHDDRLDASLVVTPDLIRGPAFLDQASKSN